VPPEPLDGTVEQITQWVEALTGLELDEGGNVRRLAEDALAEYRRRLAAPENAEFARTVPLP
jgi:hypothetical protein